MAHVNTAHRGVRIAAVLAAVIFGATACGQDHNESSSAPVAENVPKSLTADQSANGDASQVPSPTAGSGTTDTEIPPIPVPDQKFLAIDVSYGVEVDDITKGISGVVALADRHGGQIYERTINIADDRSSTASFVIKLPPEQVEAAISDLDAIGVRRTASQGTEDVTSQVVDIDARLVSAQASLDRVRKLLDSATDLGQVLSLESQLTERETLVEQLTALKRTLDDRVALATLRVQLTVSPDPASKPVVGPPKETTIGSAFGTGWNGFVKALAAVLIFIGYTAPFLVLLLIGVAVIVPISRRRRAAQRSRSTVPPPPPAPVADQQTSEPDSVGAARSR
jgi:hypothetical protein